MIKRILILGLVALIATGAYAGEKGGMAVGTASTNSITVIPPQDGSIAITAANYWQPTSSATLTKYLADNKSKAQAAISASTTCVMYCDEGTNGAAPKLDGRLLTTSDYVIVVDTTASTTTAPQLRKISAVGTVTNVVGSDYTSMTLASAVTTLANAPIYLVPSTKVITQTVTGNKEYAPAFAIGEHRMPLAVTLLTTNPGTNVQFSCTYEVWK